MVRHLCWLTLACPLWTRATYVIGFVRTLFVFGPRLYRNEINHIPPQTARYMLWSTKHLWPNSLQREHVYDASVSYWLMSLCIRARGGCVSCRAMRTARLAHDRTRQGNAIGGGDYAYTRWCGDYISALRPQKQHGGIGHDMRAT